MKIKNKKVINSKKGRPRKEQSILVKGEEAVMYSKDARHVTKRFKVHKKESNGQITITLIPWDELNKRRAELIPKLSKKLATNIDSEALMKDILEDTRFDKLEELHDAIDRGAEVKSREGCFFLEVKDKRKKKPLILNVRK